LLTNQQRIVAIFLLLENYKNEGIKKNPFAATILEISNQGFEPFERIMIAEILLDMKRDRFAKTKI